MNIDMSKNSHGKDIGGNKNMDELLFTPAAVLDLLTQIEELKDHNINVIDSGDSIQIQIGDSTYKVNTSSANDIEVEEDVVSEVSDINTDAYDELEASGTVELSEPVESGLLKSAVKSLLLGGLIRLVPDLMK